MCDLEHLFVLRVYLARCVRGRCRFATAYPQHQRERFSPLLHSPDVFVGVTHNNAEVKHQTRLLRFDGLGFLDGFRAGPPYVDLPDTRPVSGGIVVAMNRFPGQ